MKPLKCPWNLLAKIFLIPTGVFILALIVAVLIDIGTDIYVHLGAIYLNFVIQGSVWLVLFLVFFMLARKNKSKLRRLKNEGAEHNGAVMTYDGVVHEINPLHGVNISMNHVPIRADCSYINEEGKTCLVRSPVVLMSRLDRREDIVAKIYVNRQEPRDYAVELFRAESGSANADYDYR